MQQLAFPFKIPSLSSCLCQKLSDSLASTVCGVCESNPRFQAKNVQGNEDEEEDIYERYRYYSTRLHCQVATVRLVAIWAFATAASPAQQALQLCCVEAWEHAP